jgi:Fe-S-cluster containining protein
MSDERPAIPFQSVVLPEVLGEETEIPFRCYPGISCFNACCRMADVTLAPYDILRLKGRLGLSTTDFLAKHTVPFQMDADGTPGVKLRTTDEGACLLLDGDKGCSVYEDRPTVCRYYPVALLNRHVAGETDTLQEYSLVREDHCKGIWRTAASASAITARNRDAILMTSTIASGISSSSRSAPPGPR